MLTIVLVLLLVLVLVLMLLTAGRIGTADIVFGRTTPHLGRLVGWGARPTRHPLTPRPCASRTLENQTAKQLAQLVKGARR